jgi:hypothetical protein
MQCSHVTMSYCRAASNAPPAPGALSGASTGSRSCQLMEPLACVRHSLSLPCCCAALPTHSPPLLPPVVVTVVAAVSSSASSSSSSASCCSRHFGSFRLHEKRRFAETGSRQAQGISNKALFVGHAGSSAGPRQPSAGEVAPGIRQLAVRRMAAARG